jgi:hypothetical protein
LDAPQSQAVLAKYNINVVGMEPCEQAVSRGDHQKVFQEREIEHCRRLSEKAIMPISAIAFINNKHTQSNSLRTICPLHDGDLSRLSRQEQAI